MSVTDPEDECWVFEVGRLTGGFRGVRARPGHFEHLSVLLAGVQRVVGCAVRAIAGKLWVWVVAWPGAAVVLELAVTDSEGVGGAFAVLTTRVVGFLSDETWQGVARAGAAVHGSDRPTGLRVVVHHGSF